MRIVVAHRLVARIGATDSDTWAATQHGAGR
jgi:hypothetical protein